MKYKVRKFGNTYYRTSQKPTTKKTASSNTKFRKSKGQLARTVKVKGGYDTFWAYPAPSKSSSTKAKKEYRDYQKKIKKLKKN
ncbi:MAG: hypothetical protein CMC21_02060 [Flavobacteriaceae bacterium]|nr:hypothetical protein [Flavobacteriaceae bacterium]|tara:strand:+ start:6931 stop:7179 length:249 start_codon:yes stop_codon:yes gene_type:complete